MKILKKNDRFIDLENESEWTFDCRTRGPDIDNGPGIKPTMTWTCVLFNKTGERRFVPESKMATTFRRREVAVKSAEVAS
jgi:hypothetical protein